MICLQIQVLVEGSSETDIILYDDYESAAYGGRIEDVSFSVDGVVA